MLRQGYTPFFLYSLQVNLSPQRVSSAEAPYAHTKKKLSWRKTKRHRKAPPDEQPRGLVIQQAFFFVEKKLKNPDRRFSVSEGQEGNVSSQIKKVLPMSVRKRFKPKKRKCYLYRSTRQEKATSHNLDR